MFGLRHLSASLFVLLLAISDAPAAIEAFLYLEENGEGVETDAIHSWVTVLGFEQGIQNELGAPSMAGGKAGGKASGGKATLKLAPDGSVVDMLRGCAEGRTFDLTLHFVRNASLKGAGQVLVSLKFERVFFSGISLSGGDGDDFICIDVTFIYGRLEFTQSTFQENSAFERSLSTTMDFEFNEHSGPAITLEVQAGDYAVGGPPAGGGGGENPDRDGDGMPDAWEALYGLDPDSVLDAALDPDMDGFTNLQEYIAGTDPTQASSFFSVAISQAAAAPGDPEVTLRWSGVAGRVYRIEASTSPAGDYTTIHTRVSATDGPLSYTPQPGAGPFFKLVVSD